MLAPTLDDLYELIDHPDRFGGSERTKFWLASYAFMPHVEHVNFGYVDPTVVAKAAEDLAPILDASLFAAPYPVVVYRYDFDDEWEGKIVRNGCTLIHELIEGDQMLLSSMTRCPAILGDQIGCVSIVYDNLTSKRVDYECEKEQADLLGEHKADAAQALLTEFVGLTGIFQARGVPKTRTTPPAKVNAKRAKAGRPLLPYTTRVDVSAYAAAAAPGTGTHASPRPHLRKAHLRTLKDWQGNARLTAVSACVVNWDAKTPRPADRKEYQVNK
jgi:hypothetical protein